MRLVLDSNVAIKWGLPEGDSDKALAIKEAYADGTHDLLAPDIFPIEVGNAFTRAERRGILKPPESINALRDILLISPKFYDSLPLLKRAMEISSESRCNVYDCLYLALAEREGCPLLTADKTFMNSLREPYKALLQLL